MLSPRSRNEPPGEAAADAAQVAAGHAAQQPPSFESIYDRYADFVYRSVRRLGVSEAAAPDVTQEVFITIHRRLDSFEGRSSLKTWVFGVVLGIVRNHRRRAARYRSVQPMASDLDQLDAPAASTDDGPHSQAERRQAVEVLYGILGEMDDDKRELFIMADLEQIAPAQIAKLTDTKLFTVYSRLRVARAQFKRVAARYRAREGWRMP